MGQREQPTTRTVATVGVVPETQLVEPPSPSPRYRETTPVLIDTHAGTQVEIETHPGASVLAGADACTPQRGQRRMAAAGVPKEKMEHV